MIFVCLACCGTVLPSVVEGDKASGELSGGVGRGISQELGTGIRAIESGRWLGSLQNGYVDDLYRILSPSRVEADNTVEGASVP
jgi:hypothetical protein